MLRPTDAPALVLADGSLPSLVAMAIAAALHRPDQPGTRSSVLPAGLEGRLSDAQRGAAVRQAEVFGLAPIAALPPQGGGTGGGTEGGGWGGVEAGANGEHDARLLLASAYAAGRMGCRTVVWPVQCPDPGDVAALSRMLDRALLVGRLASLDAGRFEVPEVRVDPIFADLDDDALADLAVDMDCPVDTCWWFADPSPQAQQERDRWLPALARQGHHVGA